MSTTRVKLDDTEKALARSFKELAPVDGAIPVVATGSGLARPLVERYFGEEPKFNRRSISLLRDYVREKLSVLAEQGAPEVAAKAAELLTAYNYHILEGLPEAEAETETSFHDQSHA